MTAEPASKTEYAYVTLRREILSVRLAPGTPLRLNGLCDRYNLGWTPLREALSRLEAERLVTAETNRGFVVAPVSAHELADLTHTRLVLEIQLLRESIEHGDEAWEERIGAAHFRLSRCRLLSRDHFPVIDPTDDNFMQWGERHQAFHDALLSGACSNRLMRFYTEICMHLGRHQRFLMMNPAFLQATDCETGDEATINLLRSMAIDSHTLLMEAALERDIMRAQSLMTDHVRYTSKVFSSFGDGAAEPETL